jgi:hypothetical protein
MPLIDYPLCQSAPGGNSRGFFMGLAEIRLGIALRENNARAAMGRFLPLAVANGGVPVLGRKAVIQVA